MCKGKTMHVYDPFGPQANLRYASERRRLGNECVRALILPISFTGDVTFKRNRDDWERGCMFTTNQTYIHPPSVTDIRTLTSKTSYSISNVLECPFDFFTQSETKTTAVIDPVVPKRGLMCTKETNALKTIFVATILIGHY